MKEVKLAEVLSVPLKFSKKILDNKLPVREALRALEESGVTSEYKGPFMSGVTASCILNDTITVNCFQETKQPDGTYLITYVYKYIEEYSLALHIRVLTSAIKRKLKYHKYDDGAKVKIKGNLDMYISGPISFDSDDDFLPDKMANIGVAITIIDFL